MSTQYANDIPFTASNNQQAFKLLELPPDLLALLESDNPPILTITSSPSTSTTPGHAILTSTPSNSTIQKTYLLRQKNTSNPIMILTPSTTSEDDDSIPIPTITAISKTSDTIELIEQVDEKKVVAKGKWHEKFAKSREGKK